MISGDALFYILKRNLGVIERQIDGLDHAASLLQPAMRGNCMNWLMGHILVYRDITLKQLGEAPVRDEAFAARYGHDSEPVLDGSDAYPFEAIVADFRSTQPCLEAALTALTEAQLAAKVPDRDQRLAERLTFLVWHESYHTGQFEYLRQLTGINDKVI
jgi:uncharacterized damage-inducible protein DinB